jgi:hypothetical protein
MIGHGIHRSGVERTASGAESVAFNCFAERLKRMGRVVGQA